MLSSPGYKPVCISPGCRCTVRQEGDLCAECKERGRPPELYELQAEPKPRPKRCRCLGDPLPRVGVMGDCHWQRLLHAQEPLARQRIFPFLEEREILVRDYPIWPEIDRRCVPLDGPSARVFG
jgi:hypothetical protein